MLYRAHVRTNELIGSQRTDTKGKILKKTPVESAVKGDQKSFQLCSVNLLFYTTNSLRKKDTDDFLYPLLLALILYHT